MSSYSDKLKNPKWQKFRLEVFQRDGFACRFCGDKESTLHAHHLQYNGQPWEANIEDVITLCDKCHSGCEITLKMVRRICDSNRGLLFFMELIALLHRGNGANLLRIVDACYEMSVPENENDQQICQLASSEKA